MAGCLENILLGERVNKGLVTESKNRTTTWLELSNIEVCQEPGRANLFFLILYPSLFFPESEDTSM